MTHSDRIVSVDEKRKFQEDGYLVFHSGIPGRILDQAMRNFRPYWSGKSPTGIPYASTGRVQDGWVVSRRCLQIAT